MMALILPLDGGEAHSHIVRDLPDLNICRTRPIGSIKTFGACLVNCPTGCPYVVNFSEGHFCEHVNWNKFVLPPKQIIE